MCYYAEVPKSFNWDCLYSTLKFGEGFGGLSISCYGGGKGADLFEELGGILSSDRARKP